jgi:hypothetical protein
VTNRKPNIYSKVLRFRVEPGDCQQLKDLVLKNHTDMSAILRKALREFLGKGAAALA